MSVEMLEGERIKRIVFIFYSHHDYSWLCPRSWHIQRYLQGFTMAADYADERENFHWTIDNVHHSWLPTEKYCPDVTGRIYDHVKTGQFDVVNGGYSLARPSNIPEETYLRNLLAGREFFKKRFDLEEIPVLFNADTACGHSQLPQIAKLSGHRYYRFQRNDSFLTHKGVPFQFTWKGLDGSEIPVTRGNYGDMWCNNEWLEMNYET